MNERTEAQRVPGGDVYYPEKILPAVGDGNEKKEYQTSVEINIFDYLTYK